MNLARQMVNNLLSEGIYKLPRSNRNPEDHNSGIDSAIKHINNSKKELVLAIASLDRTGVSSGFEKTFRRHLATYDQAMSDLEVRKVKK